MVASWALQGMHTWVLDWREVNIVLFLAIGELDFGGLELALWALRNLFLAERNTALLTNLLIELDHVSFSIITVTIIITLLVNEDLAPQRILGNIDTLLWLEEGAARELLLSPLLPSFDDPGTLLLNSSDQAFEAGHEVFPVFLCNRSADFVSPRMIGQLQIHVLEVVGLVLFVEFLAQSDE